MDFVCYLFVYRCDKKLKLYLLSSTSTRKMEVMMIKMETIPTVPQEEIGGRVRILIYLE